MRPCSRADKGLAHSTAINADQHQQGANRCLIPETMYSALEELCLRSWRFCGLRNHRGVLCPLAATAQREPPIFYPIIPHNFEFKFQVAQTIRKSRPPDNDHHAFLEALRRSVPVRRKHSRSAQAPALLGSEISFRRDSRRQKERGG